MAKIIDTVVFENSGLWLSMSEHIAGQDIEVARRDFYETVCNWVRR